MRDGLLFGQHLIKLLITYNISNFLLYRFDVQILIYLKSGGKCAYICILTAMAAEKSVIKWRDKILSANGQAVNQSYGYIRNVPARGVFGYFGYTPQMCADPKSDDIVLPHHGAPLQSPAMFKIKISTKTPSCYDRTYQTPGRGNMPC